MYGGEERHIQCFGEVSNTVLLTMAYKFYLWYTESGQLYNSFTKLYFCHVILSLEIEYVFMYKANTVYKLYDIA